MDQYLNAVEPVVGLHHRSATSIVIPTPGFENQVGLLSAVNIETGEAKWIHRQRAGIGGSVLTTGGGLVFVSDDARRFRAFDADTGDILWEQILNSTAGGFPVSFSVEGVQYIAIAAGGGVTYRNLTPELRQRSGGNTLYVFRLPD
jgi:alcohol dehydrogenase (cytochrome c)